MTKRGTGLMEAFREAAKEARTRQHEDFWYAMFDDRSFLRIVGGKYSQVLDHHTSRTLAEKMIRGIHAYCNECRREVWCDMQGRAAPDERFELPGMELAVCRECQRQMVLMKLVGE